MAVNLHNQVSNSEGEEEESILNTIAGYITKFPGEYSIFMRNSIALPIMDIEYPPATLANNHKLWAPKRSELTAELVILIRQIIDTMNSDMNRSLIIVNSLSLDTNMTLALTMTDTKNQVCAYPMPGKDVMGIQHILKELTNQFKITVKENSKLFTDEYCHREFPNGIDFFVLNTSTDETRTMRDLQSICPYINLGGIIYIGNAGRYMKTLETWHLDTYSQFHRIFWSDGVKMIVMYKRVSLK